MPSSLAAALAATKKTPQEEQTTHTKSSTLMQHQKRQNQSKQKVSTNDNVATKSPPKKDVLSGKQHTPNSRGKKGGGTSQKKRKDINVKEDSRTSAGEEIVFVCDIPSDDEDDDYVGDDYDDDGGINNFDRLKITNQCKTGGGSGRVQGDRGNNNKNNRNGRGGGDRNNSSNNGRRVLNVNASRRLIGHALGTRIGSPPNDRSGNNNRPTSNPAAMPTPWSRISSPFAPTERQAQEMNTRKNERDNRNFDSRSKRHDDNTRGNQISRESSEWSGRTANETSVTNESAEAIPMPKLESAVLKGRWADEDSSDDE